MDENGNAAIIERLNLHEKWLCREDGGIKMVEHGAGLCRAGLVGAYLSEANLCGADLSEANLYGADLSRANLYKAYLSGADLSKANLYGADLSEANLYGADLSRANLYGADLCEANLYKADLRKANLCGADLSKANLCGADLREANLNGANTANALFICLQCPEEGVFIAWKRCGDHIVKLQVTETAKRSSATSRKCRCSEALVLDIQKVDGSPSGLTEIRSDHDASFIYRIGEVARVDDFNEDRWDECSAGIHFFITRDEAVNFRR